MKKRRMFIRMITASLMRRRSRMIVALLSVAIGATILSGLVSIYYDVPRQMGAEFRNYGANMIFTSADGELTLADMKSAASVIPSESVVGVAPYRYENIRIHDIPVVAAGTDPEGARAASPYWSVEGDWFTDTGGMIVGANVAESFRLKIGDMVEVTYTPMNDEGKAVSDTDNMAFLTVTGVLSTGGSEENYIYMTLEDMKALVSDTDRIDVAELSISLTADELSGCAARINSDGAVHASLVKRVTASEATVLTKLQALVLLVTVVVLALTMICVATTMTAVVAERRKEIGLRKAIGASDRSIIREFMGEGMLLGLFGGVLGGILGFVFAQQVSINVFGSSIVFRPLLLPVTVMASIAVTGISCLMPIRSATEVDPALVLKGE
jgi:putative ABC transport system permease protein